MAMRGLDNNSRRANTGDDGGAINRQRENNNSLNQQSEQRNSANQRRETGNEKKGLAHLTSTVAENQREPRKTNQQAIQNSQIDNNSQNAEINNARQPRNSNQQTSEAANNRTEGGVDLRSLRRDYNRESKEFALAKENRNELRGQRSELVGERRELRTARDAARQSLERAQAGGNELQIERAQGNLAEKNQNLSIINTQLKDVKTDLKAAQLVFSGAQQEFNAAQQAYDSATPINFRIDREPRRIINQHLDLLKVQVKNGEPIGVFSEQIRKTFFSDTDVPVNANLSSETAERIARQRAAAPYFKAAQEARLDLVRTGGTDGSASRIYEYGYRAPRERGGMQSFEATGKVTVSVEFEIDSKIVERRTAPNQGNAVNIPRLSPDEVQKEKQALFREMKLDLARTGADEVQRSVTLRDGRTLEVAVKADWKETESVRQSESAGDREIYRWVSYQNPERNGSSVRDRLEVSGVAALPPSAKLQGINEIKSISANKAEKLNSLYEQISIQDFIAQTRLEAVQSGETNGFTDRKIIGKNAYEVEVAVDFKVNSQRLNPNELNFVEKRIEGNPRLTREEIVAMREDFKKDLQKEKGVFVQQLKEALAISGERVAEAILPFKGELHRITVRADWNVDAELHRSVDKPDVERFLRESLVANGGKEIEGLFKYNGREFIAQGEADFDISLKQIDLKRPTQLEQLEKQKANLTAEQYEQQKTAINNRTRFEITAATQDMLNDLARTGEESISRTITTTTGERHQITVKADWDLEVKKVDQFKKNFLQALKIGGMFASMVATAGVATGAAGAALASTAGTISAGMNVLSSGIQGRWLDAGLGLVSLYGGVVGGSLGANLQFGSQAVNTLRGATDGKFTFGDFLSTLGTVGKGLNLYASGKPSVDSIKIGESPNNSTSFGDILMDIDRYGSIIDSALQGDGFAVFSGVANALVGATARFRHQQTQSEQNNQINGGVNQNDAAAQTAQDRVRAVYDNIYAKMDARAQNAANTIIENAERRGIDLAVAMAYINNLQAEGRDFDALLRNNAARRGMSVAEYRQPFDRLFADLQTNINIIRNADKRADKSDLKGGGIVPIPTDRNSMNGRIDNIPLANGQGEFQTAQYQSYYSQLESGQDYRTLNNGLVRVERTTTNSEVRVRMTLTNSAGAIHLGSNEGDLIGIAQAYLTGGSVGNGVQGTFDYAGNIEGRTATIVDRDGIQMLRLYRADGTTAGVYIQQGSSINGYPGQIFDNLPNGSRVNPGDIFGQGSNVTYETGTDLDGNIYYSVSFTDSGLNNDAGRPGVGRTMLFDSQGRLVSTVTNYSSLRSVTDYSDKTHTDLRFLSNGLAIPDGGQERARDESRSVVDVLTAGGERIATYQRQGDMYVLIPESNITVAQLNEPSSQETGLTRQELARTIQNNINGVAGQYATDYVAISESKNTLQMMADQYRIRFGDGYADDMQRTYEQTLSQLNTVANDLQNGRISVDEANRRQNQIMRDYNSNLGQATTQFGNNAQTGANLMGITGEAGRSVTATTVFLMSGGNPSAAVAAGTGYAELFDVIAEVRGRQLGVATPNNQSATVLTSDLFTNNQQNPFTPDRARQVLGQRGADAYNSLLDVAGSQFIARRTQQLTQTGMSQTRAAANAATEWQTISSGTEVGRTIIEVSFDSTLTPEQRMQRIQSSASNALVSIPLAYPTGGLGVDNRGVQFGTNTLSSLTQSSLTNGLTTGNFSVTGEQLFGAMVNGAGNYFSPTPGQMINGLSNGGGRSIEYGFADNVRVNNNSPRNSSVTNNQSNQQSTNNLQTEDGRPFIVIQTDEPAQPSLQLTPQERERMANEIMRREGFSEPLSSARRIPQERNAVISGHGQMSFNDMQYRLPPDVTITMVTMPGGILSDRVGNSIDNGVIPAGVRTRTYRGGEFIPNIAILHPADGGSINIGGASNTMFPAMPVTANGGVPVIVVGTPGQTVPLSAIIESYRQRGITEFTLSTCASNYSVPGSWHNQNAQNTANQVRPGQYADYVLNRDIAGLGLNQQDIDYWNTEPSVQSRQNQIINELLYNYDRGPQNFTDIQQNTGGGLSLGVTQNNAIDNLLITPNGQTIPGSNGQPVEGNTRQSTLFNNSTSSGDFLQPNNSNATRSGTDPFNNISAAPATQSELTDLQIQNLTPRQTTRVQENLNAVNAAGGLVNYGNLDSFGRSTGIFAYVTEGMIGRGTSANNQIYPSGFGQLYSPNNRPQGAQNSSTYNPLAAGLGNTTVSRTGNDVAARGHLLGNQLGGSGDLPSNLVTLYQRDVNHPLMERIESEVRTVVENGIPSQGILRQNVSYRVTPVYEGTSLVPRWLRIEAVGDAGYQMNVTLENTQNGLMRVNP